MKRILFVLLWHLTLVIFDTYTYSLSYQRIPMLHWPPRGVDNQMHLVLRCPSSTRFRPWYLWVSRHLRRGQLRLALLLRLQVPLLPSQKVPALTHVDPGFAQLFQHEDTFQKVKIFLSEKEEAVQVIAATVKRFLNSGIVVLCVV